MLATSATVKGDTPVSLRLRVDRGMPVPSDTANAFALWLLMASAT